MDGSHDDNRLGHRRYIWFAVALGAVVLAFAAISITVVVTMSAR